MRFGFFEILNWRSLIFFGLCKSHSSAFDFFGNLVGDGKICSEEGFAKFFQEGAAIWGFWKGNAFQIDSICGKGDLAIDIVELETLGVRSKPAVEADAEVCAGDRQRAGVEKEGRR